MPPMITPIEFRAERRREESRDYVAAGAGKLYPIPVPHVQACECCNAPGATDVPRAAEKFFNRRLGSRPTLLCAECGVFFRRVAAEFERVGYSKHFDDICAEVGAELDGAEDRRRSHTAEDDRRGRRSHTADAEG